MSVNRINISTNQGSAPLLQGEGESLSSNSEANSQLLNLERERSQFRNDNELNAYLDQIQHSAYQNVLGAQSQLFLGKGQKAIESGSGGGSNFFDQTFQGNTSNPLVGNGGGLNLTPLISPFIESARALLQAALVLMVSKAGNNNPFSNIAKLLAGKSMVEVAKTLAEAGMSEEVVKGTPMLRHEALDVDTKAAGLRGLFETAIQYWNQTAQANKQIEKDTHQLAQRA